LNLCLFWVHAGAAAEIDPDAGVGEEGGGVHAGADEHLLGLLQQGPRQVCLYVDGQD
jgi:hypothetical protein